MGQPVKTSTIYFDEHKVKFQGDIELLATLNLSKCKHKRYKLKMILRGSSG